MKLSLNQKQVFLCTGAGVGKTTYLCGLVISKAMASKQKVFVINSSNNLRYRDFVRVVDWLQLIGGAKLPHAGEYSL
jgi:biopolymer transport protein ExbD